jgi:hypothetical protein
LIHNLERKDCDGKVVVKHGCRTGWSIGTIELQGPSSHFAIPPIIGVPFASKGDSGAIVFCPFSGQVYGIISYSSEDGVDCGVVYGVGIWEFYTWMKDNCVFS